MRRYRSQINHSISNPLHVTTRLNDAEEQTKDRVKAEGNPNSRLYKDYAVCMI